MIGKLWPIAISVALAGCGSFVEKPAVVIEVPVREAVTCPDAPAVDPVKLRAVTDPYVFEHDGKRWVGIPIREYTDLVINLAELKASYAQRLAQLHYLRGCIARFNANVTPKEVWP